MTDFGLAAQLTTEFQERSTVLGKKILKNENFEINFKFVKIFLFNYLFILEKKKGTADFMAPEIIRRQK